MKTVIEMAEEAGCSPFVHECTVAHVSDLKRFAELVRADEREACAIIAETASDCLQNSTFEGVANAIRARGNTK